ncbi:dTDP-4-dehydrorhamnose reductase [Paenibacillus sp. UNCCL117]|uniref:dTDP-4-dehydrorhamnose reductase n=1 Tax=unclassified Paenibacillus TaxID=185978 RepID=UPI000888502A|nr:MULTISPECIES: dTDP-4-dehydrorhamnose reductase [unclassified Paenibacillus]SDD30513.1 dTDP-4-dehydrorhamnose reductase [Paenibacillus sp. cl123]SFW40332.1 dTDP-4-dehydrorhamnose reductase [Paenibacillus sp. UNCCL117]
MKLLITGAGGQLGRDLVRVLEPAHTCYAFTRQQLDVTDEAAMRERILSIAPDAVIYAAAYTQVDRAESEPELAFRVNAVGAGHAAMYAELVGAAIVYVSTDYVFDGEKGEPYKENDCTQPLGVYGRSKLAGEQLTRELNARHFIVRTSWLYGRDGSNFVTKILAAASNKRELTVVDDQYGSPTYTVDLAVCIGRLLETNAYGLYHVSNRGFCSRYTFAEAILAAAGRRDVRIRPARSDEFVLPAPRPANSALTDLALRRARLPRMRDWKSALEHFIHVDWDSPPESGRGGLIR